MLFQKNQVPHNKKWTKEKVAAEAVKHLKRSAFKSASPSAYIAARNMGILDEICSHMPKDSRVGSPAHNKKWTKEKVLEEAARYSTRSEWRDGSAGSYDAAKDNGWIDEAAAHMELVTDHGRWTKEACAEEAKKHITRSSWQKSSGPSYQKACRMGWLDELCTHMTIMVEHGKWNAENSAEEAKKYPTVIAWKKGSCGSYDWAYRNGKVQEFMAHANRHHSKSADEISVLSVIKEMYPKACSTRFSNKDPRFVAKRFELDIYVPELRKGVEFDGTYWHSPEGLRRGRPGWSDENIANYHEIKDDFFKSKNIKVIHVSEADWLADKPSQIFKILAFLVGDEHA